MEDLERIARAIVFGSNVSNADAVLLWEQMTGFRVRQARRCEGCNGSGVLMGLGRYRCRPCNGTGYVGGFTPGDAEGQVAAMAEAVKGGGK